MPLRWNVAHTSRSEIPSPGTWMVRVRTPAVYFTIALGLSVASPAVGLTSAAATLANSRDTCLARVASVDSALSIAIRRKAAQSAGDRALHYYDEPTFVFTWPDVAAGVSTPDQSTGGGPRTLSPEGLAQIGYSDPPRWRRVPRAAE